FGLVGGVVGESGWAGVLMPSVDRVGRHFPLTVAVELGSHGAAAHAVFEGADWFGALEDAALSVLDPTRTADDLDVALAQSPLVVPAAADRDAATRPLPAPPSVAPLSPP